VEVVLELEATVSSKGQITLPAALRAQFGLAEGSKVKFISDGKQIVLKPELPVSAYRGLLRHLGNIDTTIPKEPDRF
jgi:AbrB family looped-hinge helix DNA binding protein